MAINKEIDLRFAFGYTPLEFRDTLHMLAEGTVDPTPLITGKVGLAGVDNAFAALGNPETHAKILIDPQQHRDRARRLRAGVVQILHAAAERPPLEQLQLDPPLHRGEVRGAAPEQNRGDEDVVVIDQVTLDQFRREAGTPDRQIAAGLLLEPRDLVDDVRLRPAACCP